MRAGVYLEKEKVAVQDWPQPEPGPGEVLVRVRYAGICGTDLMVYSGKHPRVVPPRVLGHEVFGAVAEARPPADATWKPGARVAIYPLISCGRCAPCREGHAHVCEKLGLIGIDADGGFAEYVKAQPDQLFAVPDAVSDDAAALIEPLSVAVHVVRRSGFRPGDTALVVGGGPIGNLIAQVVRASGARVTIVSEVKLRRRELAEKLGLATLNPARGNLKDQLRALTGEADVDRVFEASGAPAAYRDAVDAVKVRGEITFAGLPKSPPEVDVLGIVFKEIRASSGRVYERRDYQAAISLLERRAVEVEPLITDRLGLEQADLGFQKMRDAETSLKILFAP
jgi:2-desacetyl-2-hydroxyethyl bacteriochlorophyllide A dehydrogenase